MTRASAAGTGNYAAGGATVGANPILSAIPGVRIGAELGRGAATVVYEAVREGHRYAVKVLGTEGDEAAATAFRREAALLARLNHPGLVRIHEVGDAERRPYLIMDLVVGRSLARVLADETTGGAVLDERWVVAVAVDVVGALTVAHRAGLVHRDVKPDNIMIDEDGRAKIIDFGLATHEGRATVDVAAGTFVYAAPEQTGVLHRPVDARSDLYALGVVLFECLAGTPPFVASDVGALIRMHLSAAPPDLREGRPDVSPAFAAIVAKLLAKDPDDRYTTAQDVMADLVRLASGEREAFEPTVGSAGADEVTAMVGRAGPVEALRRRWQVTLAGRGGMALVQGAPGAGKSRLVRGLTAAVRADGAAVLFGKSDPDDAVPLAPLRRAVERFVGEVSQLPAAQRPAAVQRLRTAAGPTAAALSTLSPALAELLGTANTPSSQDERQFDSAVAAFLVGLARASGGAVLHLDDLQWWDEATRRVVRELVPMLADAPLLLVATARDDAPNLPAVEAAAAEHGATLDLRLSLEPLDDAAVAALVVGHLGGGVAPADLVTSLVTRSGGNPMAAQEYVRAVIDAGLLQPYWGTWRLDQQGLADLALPDDVAGLVVVRVEGLGDLARELLTAAAATGTRFAPDLAAEVSGVEPHQAYAAFADAAARGLIEPIAGGRYCFLHDRIREALLGTLAPARVRALHQRIAEALEQTGDSETVAVYELARHYLAGDPDVAPESTFRAAWAAGTRALAEHAAAEAVDFLTVAVAIAGRAGSSPPSELHAALGAAASRVGRHALGDEHLGLALESEDRPLQRGRLYIELGVASHARWEGTRAVELILKGLAELGFRLPRNPVLLAGWTVRLFVFGLVVGLLPRRIRLVAGAKRQRYELLADLLMTGGASAAMVNRQLLMMAFILSTLYLGNRLGSGATYAHIQAGLAISATVVGLRARARRMQQRALAAALETGDPRVIDLVRYLRAIADDVVPPSIGVTTGRTTRRLLQDDPRGLVNGEYLGALGGLGALQVLRGYRADAAELYQRGIERYGVNDETLGNLFATLGAQADALGGDPARAAAKLHQVREFIATVGDNRGQLINLAAADIQLAVEQGETGAVLDQALARFAELKVNPTFLWSYQRSPWVYQAFGRLCQLAAATQQRRPERLTQAEAAIRALRRMAKGPILRAYHAAALASLMQMRGEHRTALRTLARIDERAAGLDVPLLEYEIARVRARALRGLDRHADAERQAAIALLLADRYGWRTRARWIRAEFALDAASGTSTEKTNTRQHTATGGYASSLHQRRLEAVHQVGLAASTVLDPAQLAQVALDEILEIFGAERAFLFLQDSDGDGLQPYLGRASGRTPLDELTGYGSTLVRRVHDSGDVLVVTGSEEGEALGSTSAVVHGLRSIMVAPLLFKGRKLGVVYLDSRIAKGIFTPDDVEILAAITNHVATSLETVRAAQLELAVHAAERARDTADSLRAAMNDLTSSLDPVEVGSRLAARVAAALPGAEVRLMPGDAGLPPQSGLLRCGADTAPAGLVPPGAADWLAVPLRVRGAAHGVLVVSTTGRQYADAEVGVVAAMAEQGATALDNALLFQRVEEMATRDGLTGLYNRRHFFELGEQQMRTWRRYHEPVTAVMIDIDHFKNVNDTHGHAVGDDVIREVARRLGTTLRDTDLVCRYGGEEFAVMLVRTTESDAHEAAERLHKAVTGAPVLTSVGDLPITVSLGLAGPDSMCVDLEVLLARADQALYAAKRAGRNRLMTYSS